MIKILTSNRESIEELDVESYLTKALVLVMCLSIANSVRRDFFRKIISIEGISSWILYISITLISAAVIGYLSVYISCGIIRFFSKKLGGTATLNETVVSYTAGSIPVLMAYTFTVLSYIFLANTIELDPSNIESMLSNNLVVRATSVINLIGFLLTIVITPIMIARVNRFSLIKGVISYLAMVILPAMIVLIFIAINFM